jgi:hypothetical protein
VTDRLVRIAPGSQSAPPLDLLPRPKRRRLRGWTSWIPVVLGVWLVLSTLMWPHASAAQASAVLIGALLASFGALAMYKPWVIWLDVILAIALALGALAVDHVLLATAVNQLLVAAIVLAVSLGTVRRGRVVR